MSRAAHLRSRAKDPADPGGKLDADLRSAARGQASIATTQQYLSSVRARRAAGFMRAREW